MRKATKHTSGKLTAKQAAELKALQAMPDSAIDYTDAPATKPEEWRDVVDWFKQQGRGYQTRINELLRDAMRKEAKH